MNRIYLNVAIAAITFFVLATSPAHAQMQVEANYKIPPLGKDTLCFRYHFEEADTVYYQVESADSVLFLGEPPIAKIRKEIVRVVCDSVRENGDYILSISLTEVHESNIQDGDTVERNTSAWLNRTAFLLIDSLGTRKATMTDNPNKAALAPGGAYQPLLFPTLGNSCGVQNRSWMVEDTTVYVENGVPDPVIAHQTLWRVQDMVDTMGITFHQIQYTQTALGTLKMRAKNVSFDFFAVIAAYGKLSFAPNIGVPYHQFATSDDRVEITDEQGRTRKGHHRVATHMRLKEIRAVNPERSMKIIH